MIGIWVSRLVTNSVFIITKSIGNMKPTYFNPNILNYTSRGSSGMAS